MPALTIGDGGIMFSGHLSGSPLLYRKPKIDIISKFFAIMWLDTAIDTKNPVVSGLALEMIMSAQT